MIFHINFEYAILVILMAFGISVIPGNPFWAFNLSSNESLEPVCPMKSFYHILLLASTCLLLWILHSDSPSAPQQPYTFHRTSGRIKSIWTPQRKKQNYADGLKILFWHKSNRMSLNNGSLPPILKINLRYGGVSYGNTMLLFLLLQLADLR